MILELIFSVAAAHAQSLTVLAKRHVPDPWQAYSTQRVQDLPGFDSSANPTTLDHFGGREDRAFKATGYFRIEKTRRGWIFIDPKGHPWLSNGVDAVGPGSSEREKAAFAAKYPSVAAWVEDLTSLFSNSGFNTLASWSQPELFQSVKRPLPYTPIWNFISEYAKSRGINYYAVGVLPVFDPGFAAFCEGFAVKLRASKTDPYLVGHFTDNELPFPDDALDRYLKLDASDSGRAAAVAWYTKRTGHAPDPAQLTGADRAAFLEYSARRYNLIVTHAIRKFDPNHLVFGEKFSGGDLNRDPIYRAARSILDAVPVDYYGAWSPDHDLIAKWTTLSGLPIIIAEFYAKGMDTGLPNNTGAGWIVQTQTDRGLFYQNFVLGLIADPNVIGWHWFKYMDNDPEDMQADPSNRNSNKGIVDIRYETYQALLKPMAEVNRLQYSLWDYFRRL